MVSISYEKTPGFKDRLFVFTWRRNADTLLTVLLNVMPSEERRVYILSVLDDLGQADPLNE